MASFDNLTSIETWAFRPSFETSWMSECFARDTEALTETPSSQKQGQSFSSSAGSECETVSKRIARNPVLTRGKITKRKSRASKRSTTTFITAEPANFRQMVQQVTGVRFFTGSVVEPEPQRPVGLAGYLLPTLDTSSFLLDHREQVVITGGVAVGAPSVVAEGGCGYGIDFEGFSGFPTLESWKV